MMKLGITYRRQKRTEITLEIIEGILNHYYVETEFGQINFISFEEVSIKCQKSIKKKQHMDDFL
jgi:hypothetical protein